MCQQVVQRSQQQHGLALVGARKKFKKGQKVEKGQKWQKVSQKI